jgi:hypothetical protein
LLVVSPPAICLWLGAGQFGEQLIQPLFGGLEKLAKSLRCHVAFHIQPVGLPYFTPNFLNGLLVRGKQFSFHFERFRRLRNFGCELFGLPKKPFNSSRKMSFNFDPAVSGEHKQTAGRKDALTHAGGAIERPVLFGWLERAE